MRREEKPIDCLFIGGSTQDLMMRVEQMPGSDQRVQASEYVQCCGGVSATAAAAHQSLGGVTGMITIVGEDEAGTFIRQDLAKQGFRAVQMIETSHSRSSVSMILVDRDGSRSITHYGGCIYDLEFEMLDKNLLKSAKVIHLGVMGEKLMVDLAKFAGKRGKSCSLLTGEIFRENWQISSFPTRISGSWMRPRQRRLWIWTRKKPADTMPPGENKGCSPQ